MFQVSGWNLPSKFAVEKDNKSEEKKKKTKKTTGPKDLSESTTSASDKLDVKKNPRQDKKRKRDGKEEGGSVKKQSNGQSPSSKKTEAVKQTGKTDEVAPASSTLTSKPVSKRLQKMQERLSGSRFRWINEQLYTTDSAKAVELFEKDPEIFDQYHTGFRNQVKTWPENPVDTFIAQIKNRLEKPIAAPGGLPGNSDGTVVIADMGCGEANLALELQSVKGFGKSKKAKFEVHSFDLNKANERITVADIKNVPMKDESAHVVVFCLALMGTNFLDFIKEGLRILKPRGEIWIAEIKSRFVDNDVTEFVSVLKDYGLLHKTTDESNKMFVRFEFFKPPKDVAVDLERKKQAKKKFIDKDEKSKNRSKPEGEWLLKPCIYKRR